MPHKKAAAPPTVLEGPLNGVRLLPEAAEDLERADVLCLRALGALGHIEFDLLVLVQ